VADRPLRPATHRCLGEPLPHQQANGPRAHPDAEAEASFPTTVLRPRGTFGISPSFLGLSQSSGQVTHVLLTRSRLGPGPKSGSSLHLHVLGTPPAFVLSQDQTLREELHKESSGIRRSPISHHKWQPQKSASRVRPWWDRTLVPMQPARWPVRSILPLSQREEKHRTALSTRVGPSSTRRGQSWHRRLRREPQKGVLAKGRRRTWTHNLDRGSIDECACC
jgi:hypothetical protein